MCSSSYWPNNLLAEIKGRSLKCFVQFYVHLKYRIFLWAGIGMSSDFSGYSPGYVLFLGQPTSAFSLSL